MNKITKKQRLTNLLKIDINNYNYEIEINTIIKSYNEVCNKLKLDKDSVEADIAYKWIYNKNIPIGSLTCKSRKEKDYINDLEELFTKQKEYYHTKIYPKNYERYNRECHRIADIALSIEQDEVKYSIPEHLYIITNALKNNLDELTEYINNTISLAFNEGDKYSFTNVDKLQNLIEESINDYNFKKHNYSNLYNAPKINPYKNLYMLIENSYINKMYSLNLIDNSFFAKLVNFEIDLKIKDSYTLRDIAIYLCKMINKKNKYISDKEINAIYERIKKSFQNNEYIQAYKNKHNIYEFKDIVTPIAHYLYFSKKNIKDLKEVPWIRENPIITFQIRPILNALLNKNNKLKFIYKYIDFVNDEFKYIFSSLNNRYQDSMFGFLKDTIIHIYFRLLGLKKELIYEEW